MSGHDQFALFGLSRQQIKDRIRVKHPSWYCPRCEAPRHKAHNPGYGYCPNPECDEYRKWCEIEQETQP